MLFPKFCSKRHCSIFVILCPYISFYKFSNFRPPTICCLFDEFFNIKIRVPATLCVNLWPTFPEAIVEFGLCGDNITNPSNSNWVQWDTNTTVWARQSSVVVIFAVWGIVFLWNKFKHIACCPVINNLGKSQRNWLFHFEWNTMCYLVNELLNTFLF